MGSAITKGFEEKIELLIVFPPLGHMQEAQAL